MAEPELVDKSLVDPAPGATTEEAAPTRPQVYAAPLAPDPTPTYHLHVWATPPEYICQVCNGRASDRATMVAHLATEHGLEAIPTLLAHQVETGMLQAQMAMLGVEMAAPLMDAPAPAEEPKDDRDRNDRAPGPDTGVGAPYGDDRAPDVRA